MNAFLAGLGFGAIVGVPVSWVTTKLLLRRKRLRFPHGIPRVRYWDENWNEIGRR